MARHTIALRLLPWLGLKRSAFETRYRALCAALQAPGNFERDIGAGVSFSPNGL